MTIGCNIWMICLILIWFFYGLSRMFQLPQFVWALRISVWDVFINLFLVDATDSKISSDQKRFFIALSLYPLSFFANTPFNLLIPFPFPLIWTHPYSLNITRLPPPSFSLLFHSADFHIKGWSWVYSKKLIFSFLNYIFMHRVSQMWILANFAIFRTNPTVKTTVLVQNKKHGKRF